ncbi:MAG: bifunctional amidotransferase subunit GatB/aspartate--tRNA ligase AspS [Cyclobacteriaceae bacterium]
MKVSELTKILEQEGLETVIGLETHVRLNTATKLFCACPNQESEEANHNICSVCTGQMGVLPAINSEAIKKAIYFGKAVSSSMKNEVICWDRKHYEYPDQPKNFQLTQFQKPIIPDGEVNCYRNDGTSFSVQLEQVHLEEDAAKLQHEKNNTLVDFNKSGVPLIEVVTKPCMRRIEDASTYAQYVQRIVQNLGISEANLEKGEFKSDVSVSLRKKGTEVLNARTEIKNLNSFKFMIEALEEEITKQLDYYQENKDFRPDQTTVLWDEELKQTKTMRKKEYASDYRFVLEPDIPAVDIRQAVKDIQVDQALLPYSIETTLIKGDVLPQDAKFFTSDAIRSQVFLALNAEFNAPSFVAKTLANNIKPEDYGNISTDVLKETFGLLKAEKVTPVLFQTAIKKVLKDSSFDYLKFFKENSISDDKVAQSIAEVISENQAVADEIQGGNVNKAGILVGKVLQKVGKGANGKVIRQQIIDQLAAKEAAKVSTSTDSGEITTAQTAEEKEEENRFADYPLVVKENYRTDVVKNITEEDINKEISVAGWVASVRDHGELVFIDLRDASYEVLQVRLIRANFTNLDDLGKLKPESVIAITGTIVQRTEEDYNPSIRTGKLEMEATVLDVLNVSKTLPFEIKKAAATNESIRFKYKFLDHRSRENRQAIINRHKVIKVIRDRLDDQEFIEVETPILNAGTDEGAREFIVPSRKQPGSFYTLPQAPQQCKQMLMVGGFDKYFQIARCFRDEDSRGDRQPEFTQLDIEMAFVSMQNIIDLNTELLQDVVKKVYGNKWQMKPFQVIPYYESMEKYGNDRPDLRFGLEMQTITDEVKETSFQVFAKPIEEGGIVKCIKVPAEYQKKRISKGQIEKLTAIAQDLGLGGLAYIIVNENDLQSPIIKFLGEEIAQKIIDKTEAKVGDIVFFSAADYDTANKALSAVRLELGTMLNLIKPKELHPAWVVDFPFFEKTDEGRWTFTHNPFSMPNIEHVQKHLDGKDIAGIIAQQYDLVLNGYEIGGGSIRAHKAEILEATYKNMGYDAEDMRKSVGHMYDAFHFGAPPHGGIAWGVDRLLMILEKKNSIREVIAFPKTGSGEDLLFGAPSPLSTKKVEEMNVRVIGEKG